MEGRFNRWFFALPVWGAYIWRGLFSEFYGITLNLASFYQIYYRLRLTNTSGILSSACCKPISASLPAVNKGNQNFFFFSWRLLAKAASFIAKIIFRLPKLPRKRRHYDSRPKTVDVGWSSAHATLLPITGEDVA